MSFKPMVVAILMTVASSALAQTADLSSRPFLGTSRLWIEGGSNIKDWSCRAVALDGRASMDTSARTANDGRTTRDAIHGVTLSVAVRDFKCGNAHMERDLYRALRADDPATGGEIRASLSAEALGVGGARRSSIETSGTVTVAGVAKPVRSTIVVERLENGSLRATGSVAALMTDFGVTPPKGLMGLVRSRNEVVVRFDLLISDPAAPLAGSHPR
jgi:hypothetical protein